MLFLTQICFYLELLLEPLRQCTLSILVDLAGDDEVGGAPDLLAREASKIGGGLVSWEAIEHVENPLTRFLIFLELSHNRVLDLYKGDLALKRGVWGRQRGTDGCLMLFVVDQSHGTLGTNVLLKVLGDSSLSRKWRPSDEAPVDFDGSKDLLPVLCVPL